jgi:hypothetical protein
MNDKNNRVRNLLMRKLNTSRVVAGQFVWVESKQLCRDINTSLKILKKLLTT